MSGENWICRWYDEQFSQNDDADAFVFNFLNPWCQILFIEYVSGEMLVGLTSEQIPRNQRSLPGVWISPISDWAKTPAQERVSGCQCGVCKGSAWMEGKLYCGYLCQTPGNAHTEPETNIQVSCICSQVKTVECRHIYIDKYNCM